MNTLCVAILVDVQPKVGVLVGTKVEVDTLANPDARPVRRQAGGEGLGWLS